MIYIDNYFGIILPIERMGRITLKNKVAFGDY